jgi:O-6-methylguanine DNA methyltransferase
MYTNTFLFTYTSPIGPLRILGTPDFLTGIFFENQNIPLPLYPKKNTTIYPIQSIIEKQLTDYFGGIRTAFDIPMLQLGSAFQQKIWRTLQTIEYGETCTYKALAIQTGDVKAIRALARANGQNRLPIIIPCHRVLGNNGKLIGYSGELWRKFFLLKLESPNKNGVQTLF